MQSVFSHGRLGGIGYLSILPVDQGIEHSAAASFAPNPTYFDPRNIVELAIEGGCNAVATTLGALGILARRYAHRIPFIVKLNHNELLTYPARYDQVMFGSPQQAFDLGARVSAPPSISVRRKRPGSCRMCRSRSRISSTTELRATRPSLALTNATRGASHSASRSSSGETGRVVSTMAKWMRLRL